MGTLYVTDHLQDWALKLGVSHKELTEAIVKIRDLLLKKPRDQRLRAAHRMMDHFNGQSEMAKKSSCGKGCSFCCHQRIMLIEEEVDLIVMWIKKQGIEVDMDLLEKQSKFTKEDYFQGKDENTKCVFLEKDGRCGIYPVRPSSCRNYFVSSDPKYCKNETFMSWPKGKKYPVTMGVEPNAHYVSSTLLNMSRSKATYLASAVYERLKKD